MKRLFTTDIQGSSGHGALLFLRIAAGILLLTHGLPKVQRLFSGEEIRFADPYGLGMTTSLALAAFAEFVCTILVMLGFAARLATIPIIITMATAVIFAHADDPFGVKEKPLLFLVIYAFILIIGPGRYSLDRNLGKRLG